MQTNPIPPIHKYQIRITAATILVNTMGALLLFLYLNLIDPIPEGASTVNEISPFTTAIFIATVLLTFGLAASADGRFHMQSVRWYNRIRAGEPATIVPEKFRRKVLNYPLTFAGMSLMMWLLGAAIAFIASPNKNIVTTPVNIAGVGGIFTTPLVYFASELLWRPVVAVFFPEGGLSKVGGIRVTVVGRLLLVLVVIGLWPILLLTGATIRRAYALPNADNPAVILANMLLAVVFILAFSIGASILTSILLTRSIDGPLRVLEEAMHRVEHNDFNAHVTVTTNDELGYLGEHFNQMTTGLRRGEQIRNLLNLYVSPEVAREAVEKGAALGGETVECTVLFSDIRAFTSLSEILPPSELIGMLNEYMSAMIEVVMTNGGFVNKFGGDSLLAVFGTPLNPTPDHAARAVRTAVEMRKALVGVNHRQAAAGRSAIRFGIGIATGMVVAGNVGGHGRLEYTVLGDTVNLAARLQGQTVDLGCDILLNEATYRYAYAEGTPNLPPAHKLPPVKIRGKAEPVSVYTLD